MLQLHNLKKDYQLEVFARHFKLSDLGQVGRPQWC